MKLLIDIEEDYFEILKDNIDKGFDYKPYSIIAKGQPYKELNTGNWIDDTSLGYHISVCSCCEWRGHGDKNLIYRPKYCPNCGCRMVEPQESGDKE